MLGGIRGRRRRGWWDEMSGWHHWLGGRDSEWTLGIGDGQGGLVCCDSWGRKESDTTEQLNWTERPTLSLPHGSDGKEPALKAGGSLGPEDPLEKEMAIHSSILAWKIPWTEELGGYMQSIGSQRVRHDWATTLSHFPPPNLSTNHHPHVGANCVWEIFVLSS